jgi:hypothetical protein
LEAAAGKAAVALEAEATAMVGKAVVAWEVAATRLGGGGDGLHA